MVFLYQKERCFGTYYMPSDGDLFVFYFVFPSLCEGVEVWNSLRFSRIHCGLVAFANLNMHLRIQNQSGVVCY